MAAPTTCCSREKSSCQPGAVHTWLQVAILIEEADGAKVARFSRAFMAWPLSLGARFRRQSRAPKGAPLTGKGLTAQRGRARGLIWSNRVAKEVEVFLAAFFNVVFASLSVSPIYRGGKLPSSPMEHHGRREFIGTERS